MQDSKKNFCKQTKYKSQICAVRSEQLANASLFENIFSNNKIAKKTTKKLQKIQKASKNLTHFILCRYIKIMRKTVIVCISCLLFAVFAGVVVFAVLTGSSNKVVYATSFKYVGNAITLNVGRGAKIKADMFEILPSNCTVANGITFDVESNDDVIQFDSKTGEMIATNVGNCTILAYINSSPTKKLCQQIPVAVVDNMGEPDGISSEEMSFEFSVLDGVVVIEIPQNAQGSAVPEVDIVLGADCIDILEVEADRICVSLNAVGKCVLNAIYPSKILEITITIT